MTSKRDILFIAPVPTPGSEMPITGNALPIIKTIEYLKYENNIYIVDLSKEIKSGFSFLRLRDMINIFFKVSRKKSEKDIIYLTIAESFFGNLRDLVIYMILFRKLGNTIIHLLGGANFKKIIEPKVNLIYFLNKYFISKVGAIIVEGEPQKRAFSNVADANKIFINPNFAEDYLFISESAMESKFLDLNKLKVLFLSNHLKGKGYDELSSAYISLDQKYKSKIEIDFVGDFPKDGTKEPFLTKIKDEPGLKYHGPLKGESKKAMFHQAHVFCMPTYYPYEGQPFSIVEAYAGGCMVITTNHSGISYIFADGKNGMEVEKKSVISIRLALIKCLEDMGSLKEFGQYNLNEAKKRYNLKSYLKVQSKVIEYLK